MKKVQYAESIKGDLSKDEWTFRVEDLELRGGVFAIVRKEDYTDLLMRTNDCFSSLMRVIEYVNDKHKEDLTILLDDNTIEIMQNLE